VRGSRPNAPVRVSTPKSARWTTLSTPGAVGGVTDAGENSTTRLASTATVNGKKRTTPDGIAHLLI
jgi:hypothetical protein